MTIETTRFGRLAVDADRVLTFHQGFAGVPGNHRFAMITPPAGSRFSWLQSVDEPAVAFLVTDPRGFFGDYDVTIREDLRDSLLLGASNDVRVLVTCNTVGDWLTGNLLGPIVINPSNGLAEQVVQTERKWTTRQPLVKLVAPAKPLARAA